MTASKPRVFAATVLNIVLEIFKDCGHFTSTLLQIAFCPSTLAVYSEKEIHIIYFFMICNFQKCTLFSSVGVELDL